VEVIVVDSASNDGTAELVEEWDSEHRDVNLRLIRENEKKRQGSRIKSRVKVRHGDIVVTADADAIWPNDTLRKP